MVVLGEYLAQQIPLHEEDPSLEMQLRNQWLWLEQGVIEYAPAVQAVSN